MSRFRAFVARQPYEVHALVAVLVIGFFLRLSISPLGVYPSDGASIRLWAVELGQHAPWQYYDRTYSDHLPGDLWLLWGVARIWRGRDAVPHRQPLLAPRRRRHRGGALRLQS